MSGKEISLAKDRESADKKTEEDVTFLGLHFDAFCHILDQCDYTSITNLRKTCRHLRSHLIIQPVQCPISSIYLKQYRDRAILKFRFGETAEEVTVEYAQHQKQECVIRFENKQGKEVQKFVQGEHYTSVFFSDLSVLLDHGMDSVLDELHLDSDYLENGIETSDEEKSFVDFSERLEIFLTRDELIKTKSIIIRMRYVELVHALLVLVDPDHLKKIHFTPLLERDKFGFVQPGIDLDELTSLEQWKRAEELIIEDIESFGPVQEFFHFKDINILCNMMQFSDIDEMMKNMFTSHSESKCFTIEREVSMLLSAEARYGTPFEDKYYFRTTTTNTNRILELTWMTDKIEMKLMTRSDVPYEATIIDFETLPPPTH